MKEVRCWKMSYQDGVSYVVRCDVFDVLQDDKVIKPVAKIIIEELLDKGLFYYVGQ